jgi:translation initiation factor 3 subunit E
MKTRRLNVVQQLQELNDSCEPILSLMTNDELMKKMETMRDSRTLMTFLQEDMGVRSLH